VATVSRASQLESTIPLLQRCSFQENKAQQRGGAISNSDQSRLGLEDCTFFDNHAGSGGGALANSYRTRAVLVNCRFSANRSDRGEPDVATDESSALSHDRSDWPDQASPPRPTGFGPRP
jgi:predicted outer membrane repeat protein